MYEFFFAVDGRHKTVDKSADQCAKHVQTWKAEIINP